MSVDLPEPPYGPEVDVRDLNGFYLDVEKLMASELVALSSHEVIAAALLLWCRSWKQVPAASLPDDDRVIAAFARLPLPRFKKLKDEVLRGFYLCSDGRRYHRTLGDVAIKSHRRQSTFRDRRERDAERLRKWRSKQDRNGPETSDEPQDETRFVRSGNGNGNGNGKLEERDAAGPPLRDGIAEAEVVPAPQAELFRRGKEVFGKTSGGLIRKLLTAKGENVALARAVVETASQAGDPREYLGAIIAGRDRDSAHLSARDRGEAW